MRSGAETSLQLEHAPLNRRQGRASPRVAQTASEEHSAAIDQATRRIGAKASGGEQRRGRRPLETFRISGCTPLDRPGGVDASLKCSLGTTSTTQRTQPRIRTRPCSTPRPAGLQVPAGLRNEVSGSGVRGRILGLLATKSNLSKRNIDGTQSPSSGGRLCPRNLESNSTLSAVRGGPKRVLSPLCGLVDCVSSPKPMHRRTFFTDPPQSPHSR